MVISFLKSAGEAVLLLLALTGCQAPDASSAAVEASTPPAAPAEAHAEEHPELALHMSHLQRWTHKAALAIRARNQPLADFYVHELEETVEGIQEEVPTYEGYAIAKLTEQLLVPTIEPLEAALDAGDWAVADARFQVVVTSCNTCHAATDHGFIDIDATAVDQPFLQSFAPAKE